MSGRPFRHSGEHFRDTFLDTQDPRGPSFCRDGDTHVSFLVVSSRPEQSRSKLGCQYMCSHHENSVGQYMLYGFPWTCPRKVWICIRFLCFHANVSDTCIVFIRFQYMCSGWCFHIESRQHMKLWQCPMRKMAWVSSSQSHLAFMQALWRIG